VPIDHEEKWFALQVRTRTEHQAATILRAKGYEEFLPVWSAKKRSNSPPRPLFPGYIFCRMNAQAQGLIVTTPGVIRIVSFGGRPAPVDPEEIQSIQIIINSGLAICMWRGLELGVKVYIQDGPLRGAMGVITSIRAKQRLVVSVPMMMRTIAVEIEPDCVAAVGPLPPSKLPISIAAGKARTYQCHEQFQSRDGLDDRLDSSQVHILENYGNGYLGSELRNHVDCLTKVS